MKDTHKQTIVEWKKTNSKTQQSEIKNKKTKLGRKLNKQRNKARNKENK